MDFIDLRSDTVTHPTEEMRAAMAKAEVGDDVLKEDPTVNRLQELAAKHGDRFTPRPGWDDLIEGYRLRGLVLRTTPRAGGTP